MSCRPHKSLLLGSGALPPPDPPPLLIQRGNAKSNNNETRTNHRAELGMAPLNKGPFPWQPGQVLGGRGLWGPPQWVSEGSCRSGLHPCTVSSRSFGSPGPRGAGKSSLNPRHTHKFSFQSTHAVKRRLMTICHILYSTLNGANLIFFFFFAKAYVLLLKS